MSADRTAVMGPASTARDRRWRRNFGRGTLVAAWALLTLWLASLFTWHTLPHQLAAAAVLAWWASGVVGALRHSAMIPTHRGLHRTVAGYVELWRSLPAPERERARPVIDALFAAGIRGDIDGVLDREIVLDRAAREAAGRPYPGYRDDVSELDSYLDGAQEVHRD